MAYDLSEPETRQMTAREAEEVRAMDYLAAAIAVVLNDLPPDVREDALTLSITLDNAADALKG